ncbi:MAG: GRAS family protein [Candidatus Methylumidiphilus sp.]
MQTDNFSMNSAWRDLLCELEDTPSASQMGQLRKMLADSTARIAMEPHAFLETLFLNAIHNRFNPHGRAHGNLYLRHFEIPQIVLFDLLINKFPLVSMSHGIVNDTLKHVLADGPHSVLIDIGIGRGIQTAKLIEAMALDARLRTLTVIGVEPSSTALAYAGQLLAKVAQQTPFKVIFKPLPSLVEALRPQVLLDALPEEFHRLAINASLTANHIPSVPQRIVFFEMMRKLRPDAFLLTEPESNHMEADWRRRVENAYVHYGTIFSLIDQLYVGAAEKNGLKMFFGREIDDVVANPEDQRFERHEPGKNWLEYMAKTGFDIGPPVCVDELHKARGINYRQEAPGYLSMGHKGVKVLSILHGKCC